jgi:hypothetical protein
MPNARLEVIEATADWIAFSVFNSDWPPPDVAPFGKMRFVDPLYVQMPWGMSDVTLSAVPWKEWPAVERPAKRPSGVGERPAVVRFPSVDVCDVEDDHIVFVFSTEGGSPPEAFPPAYVIARALEIDRAKAKKP